MPEGAADQPPSKTGSPPEAKPQVDNLAQLGFETFIDSVRTCPASDYAGASILAARSRKLGIDPVKLGAAVLLDQAKIDQIYQAGLNQHLKYNRGPRDAIRWTERKVRETVEGNFKLAGIYLDAGLTDEELAQISGRIFHNYDDADPEVDKDREIGIIAQRMMREARARNKVSEEQAA